ncbi:transglutaminase family protein [Chitinolyticbacter meiyuanensis]|uniref:transglutaminase family protein n=1 Tax=Chitinolyticbacter meiyuanensis TaxID=682798 RepID=UPI0011E58A0C|nr:transglutaminase family protein [Chitinolyticbacter meiyuanensis]
MLLDIHHETVYRYAAPLAHSAQVLRLTPRQDSSQVVLGWALQLPGRASQGHDAYGNTQHLLTLDGVPHELRIVAAGRVETFPARPHVDALPHDLFRRSTALTRADDEIAAFAERYRQLVAVHGRHGLLDLMADLLDRMPYTPGETDSETTAAAAFQLGRGVCQDHSHVFLAASRELGLPARYVSGYLYTDHDEHVASHAWTEVWCGDGWYGFDASNGCVPDERYVRLAIGLDYLEASPVRGVRRGGGEETLVSRALVTQAQQQQQ